MARKSNCVNFLTNLKSGVCSIPFHRLFVFLFCHLILDFRQSTMEFCRKHQIYLFCQGSPSRTISLLALFVSLQQPILPRITLTTLLKMILRGDSEVLEDIKTEDAQMNEFLLNVPAFRYRLKVVSKLAKHTNLMLRGWLRMHGV